MASCRSLLLVLCIASHANAQWVPAIPGYTFSQLATGIPASGESMAADRFGNVWIVAAPPGVTPNRSITQVLMDGTVIPNVIPTVFNASQLAYDPIDGLVNVATNLGPSQPGCTVWRLLPGGTLQFRVAFPSIQPLGLTFDFSGRMMLGTSGDVWMHDPAGPLGNLAQVATGFGANFLLAPMVNGDIIAGGVLWTVRFTPGQAGYTQHWMASSGTNGNKLVSLEPSPFNRVGPGVFVGARQPGYTSIFGSVVYTDLVAATVSGVTVSFGGFRALARGHRRDMYWYGINTTSITGSLWRVTEDPVVGGAGSLFATPTGPGAGVLDVYGPATGGHAFTLWGRPAATVIPLFLPGQLTLVEIDPLSSTILVDGLGLFGPADPLGSTGAAGAWSLSVSGPSLTGTSFDLQFVMSAVEAPDQAFILSNVASVALP